MYKKPGESLPQVLLYARFDHLQIHQEHRKKKFFCVNMFPEETLNDFLSGYPQDTLSMSFGQAAVLAYVRPPSSSSVHRRYSTSESVLAHFSKGLDGVFCGIDDIYCLHCSGKTPINIFSVLFMSESLTESWLKLWKQGSDGGVELYWGIAADGSVVKNPNQKIHKKLGQHSGAFYH
ncbi:PREDICTED: uncharacterized protein LOC104799919 isoform X1 [Tarenaya hassleriana]|uniref:uncharacterized protein LOC104799919 isoform X1 n=1 Tax=Tarenaya hassleriana TaxID=28532 RepID=UPI00053C23D4|nr:PREDICTED: uncharacterized protein LOC104799919 isoform X1 [Tarenaya hassleriana]